MKLNLREVIEMPGGSLPFEHKLDASRLDFPSITSYKDGPSASGVVKNIAGVLNVEGEISAVMRCVCDRCGREFTSSKTLPIEAVAVTQDEPENPAAFTLEGDLLDIGELLETLFILDMETKFLCDEDCKGVCEKCGVDLNKQECSCRPETDPRLAVLEQLLDDK